MRSTQRLTEAVVKRLQAPSPLRYTKGKNKGQPMPQIIWDSALKGFGVMVSATSPTKTFIVRISVKGQAKRPRISLGKFGVLTVDEARQRALGHIKAAGDGIDLKAEEKRKKKECQTLQEALNRHIDDCNRRQIMKPRSIEKLKHDIERHLKPWLALPLNTITRQLVAERHAEIPGEIAKGGAKKGYKGTTQANQAMRAFRRVFNVACADDEKLPRNPVDVLRDKRLWYPEPKREDHIAPTQLAAFWSALEACDNSIQSDLIKFMILTGLREGNASALQWGQVDFQRGVIRFERTQMKSGRVHELPMSDYLHTLLSKRREMGVVEGGWVWPARNRRTGPGHTVEPRKMVEACAKKAGVKKLCIHGLRRTFSTLSRRVIAYDEVKSLIDHAKDKITDRYIISSVDSLREPMQKATNEILILAGVNITDPAKLPKDGAALQAAYVRRFGDVTFTTFDMEPAKRDAFMREGLLRMTPITDGELIARGEMADYRLGLMSPIAELETERAKRHAA